MARIGSRAIHAPDAGSPATSGRGRRWAARAGVGAFVFFLVKGLLWLIVPGALALFTL